MKRIFLIVCTLIILPIALIGCGSTSNETNDNGKLKVSVSISPLKEFTQIIGGDRVDVTCLVPDNVEPHEFELKTRDIENVIDDKIFIYNGLGMETWIDDVKSQLANTDVKFIDSSTNVNSITTDGKEDPHSWLSLSEALVQSKNIKEALISADPDGKDYYEQNYNKFKADADSLYNEYKPKFEKLDHKNFITSHAAFGYLCRDFGLNQQYLNDIFGEGEPTAKTYETLAKYCNDNGVKTIFSESGESSKEAETLANEIKGNVKSIYTLETKPEGLSYLEAMKVNLDEIYTSLSK